MAQPLLTKIQTIGLKEEAAIGTPETLADADGQINAYDVSCNPDVEVQTREGQGGFDMLTGVPGAQSGTMTFTTDFEWDGTTTLPPWFVLLMKACGIVESTNVLSPVSSVPSNATDDVPGALPRTITLGRYLNGVYKVLSGCMGTFEWNWQAGEKMPIVWTFNGIWQPVTDLPIITPTYPRDHVWRYASATTTINATDICFASGTFNPQNVITMRECGTTRQGYENALRTSHDPIFTCDPESRLMADKPNYIDLMDAVERAFSIVVTGPSPLANPATLTLAAPKAQYRELTEADREGIATDDTTLQFNKNDAAQDQSFSITLTPSAA